MDGKETTGGGMLVTSKEAARMLGMSVRGFRRAVERTGTLKKHPASGRFKHWFSRSAVMAWAREGCEKETGAE